MIKALFDTDETRRSAGSSVVEDVDEDLVESFGDVSALMDGALTFEGASFVGEGVATLDGVGAVL